MRRWGTFLGLGIALLLVCLVWFFFDSIIQGLGLQETITGESAPTTQQDDVVQGLTLDADQIRSIDLIGKDATVHLRKETKDIFHRPKWDKKKDETAAYTSYESWVIEDSPYPITATTDSSKMETLLKTLCSLPVNPIRQSRHSFPIPSSFTPKKDQQDHKVANTDLLDEYLGLSPPEITIRITNDTIWDDERVIEIQAGIPEDTTGAMKQLHALSLSTDPEYIYFIRSDHLQPFKITKQDIRNRIILDFPEALVDEIVITNYVVTQRKLVFHRYGSDWFLNDGNEKTCDTSRTKDTVQALFAMRAKAFLPHPHQYPPGTQHPPGKNPSPAYQVEFRRENLLITTIFFYDKNPIQSPEMQTMEENPETGYAMVPGESTLFELVGMAVFFHLKHPAEYYAKGNPRNR